MGLIFNLSLIALFCAVNCLQPLDINLLKVSKLSLNINADQPLMVEVKEIGDRYAVFNVTGSDTVGGQPVTNLFINYTTDGPKVNESTKILSTVASNGKLQQIIKVVDLMPGRTYVMQFSAENAMKKIGPPSKPVSVLLLPPTPDITILHPTVNTLKVVWGQESSHSEDYYILTVEKKSALGCGVTVNLTSCFGRSYTLDDLEMGQVYRLSMMAHNPTGFSEPVVVSYPID